MFAEMMVDTNRETLKRIFRANIQQTEKRPAAPRPIPANLKMQHDESAGMGFTAPPQGARQGAQAPPQNQQQRQPISVEEKTGRNDPCPCGSGKKFKKCCGKAI